MDLLGVSGGIDSMCLAETYLGNGRPFGIAHCNFRLRGEESDGDEAFVREWAEAHGIPFHVARFDTRTYAAEHGISIEMAARELRYRFFAETAAAHGYDAVAVAHNANDNAETLLLNLLRGTGLRGACGMKAVSTLPVPDCSIPLLRPLLGLTRDEITARMAGLPYREDRLWNVIPYMHMGALVEFGTGAAYKGIFERELAEGPGLLQSFRIDDDLDLFLDLRAIVVRGQASGDAASRVGLIPAALIGLTGHPGGRGFDTVERNAPEALRSEKARWALSLNLADAALLGTVGGSLQWGPSRHFSVENSLRLNAFSFRDAALYDQRQTFTTAVRWWPWHIYSGFYVRASAQVEAARRKGIPLFSEGAGEAYGAGLSAGYSLLLSRHLNLEFGAGFWGGRLRPAGTENRRWFIAPDGLTLAIVLVL